MTQIIIYALNYSHTYQPGIILLLGVLLENITPVLDYNVYIIT